MNGAITTFIMLATVGMADGTQVSAVGEQYASIDTCRRAGEAIVQEVREANRTGGSTVVRFEYICEPTCSRSAKEANHEE